MNISASTASRNMFAKGHVHKHPLWRIKTVVLGFLTNKNNHSVIRATAGGYVQPNKQGFVHLDLPTEGPQGAGGGGRGAGNGVEGQGSRARRGLEPPSGTGPQPPLLPPRWGYWQRLTYLGVSFFTVEKTGVILVIPPNISNKWLHREHCMGSNSISRFFSNKVAH